MKAVSPKCLPPGSRASRGFTLIELLVSMTVLLIIVGFGISILGQVSNVWRTSSAKIEAFQSARVGFDLVTRHVSQMTLNTYLDYLDDNNHFLGDKDASGNPLYDNKPMRYARQSDLHFVCAPCNYTLSPSTTTMPGTANTGTAAFFQVSDGFIDPPDPGNTAPTPNPDIGLNTALNSCGYYVEFGSDSDLLPPHVANGARYRYRLKQLLVPTEKNAIFAATSSSSATISYNWFTDFTTPPAGATAQKYYYPVANNIIAFILQPMDPSEDPLAPTSLQNTAVYDSRARARDPIQPVTANQLPPVMRVTMIAIDEVSALRMQNGTQEPTSIKGMLAGKFQDPSKLSTDLNDPTTGLVPALNKAKIGYRIFSSSVAVRGSKWTK